ncbi:MAG: 4Fe-4S binding protein [Sphaerochaeta sp.]|nr:4Fe-4S binding protein [Sphaerochaeta sp.]
MQRIWSSRILNVSLNRTEAICSVICSFRSSPDRSTATPFVWNAPAPQFGSPNCILCKKCIRICPAHALTTDGKRIVIDTRVCVRCYCCHEVCPANAITIKES